MSSGDFNYVTLRNIVPSRPDGSFIQNGYVFTIGPDSKQLWTNDLYLRFLSVSTIAVNSTLRLTNGSFFVFYASSLTGSTSITETLTVYSTIDTSTISGNNVFYSTMNGSTLTTSTLNVSTLYYSSLFGSSITTSTISASTIYYSTLVGSTQATSSFFGSTIAFSTGTASTLFTHLFSASTSHTNNGFYSTLTGSSITTSTLSGSSIYFSTLHGSTLLYSTATGNILINNDFYGSSVNTNNGFYSTLTGSTLTTSTLNVSTLYYSSLFGSSITTSTLFGSTIAFSTGTASTLFTHFFSGSTVNINRGLFSTLTGSSIFASTITASTLYYSTVVGSTLTTSLLILESTMTGSTLNTINTTYSTLLGSTFTTNTGFWNSTLTGSTITTTRLNFSSMIGSTISTNTLHASTLITVSTGHLGIGMTNPTYNLQTNTFNSVNLSGNYIQTWINIFTGTDATAFTATYNGTMSGPSGSPAAISVLLGVYTNTVLTYTGNLVPGNAYSFTITVKMTGTSPYFYLCNSLTTSPADQQIPGSSSVNITGVYQTYTVSFVAPSGKFGLSFVAQGGTTVSYYGFQIQGFFSQLTGGIGIGTTNPRYAIDAPIGSIQAYNLQQFEWINTQTSNTLGYNPAAGAGLYRIATLGTTSAGFGMVNVRGQIGGFLGTGVMYVDLSIVTRGGLKVWGTVSGFQNSSGLCDLVYSINANSQYDIYIFIKTTTTIVYDLMVSGASGNNVLYDPATAGLLSTAMVPLTFSLTSMANIFPSSSGFVGIGKTDPAFTLDVAGNINVSGSVLVNGTPISAGGGGSSQWASSGANIYYNTGFVGIGTVNPTTSLYVYGNSGTFIGTTIQNGSLGGNSYTMLSLLNDTGLGCHMFINSSGRTADGGAISMATLRNDAGILRLQAQGGGSNPTFGIIILPSGNVGVGSSSPLTTLDVAGTVQGQTAFQSSPSVTFPVIGNLQAVYLGQYGAAAVRGTCVRIGDIAGAAYFMATGSANLTFYKDVSAANPVSVMYFSGGSTTGATPNVVVNNQLGVGTAPAYPLHVYQGSSTFTPTAYFTSPSSDTTLDLVNTAASGRYWRIGSGGTGSGTGVGNFYVYDFTASITRMVIDLNGYVGIGTVSPAFRLDVVGTVRGTTGLVSGNGTGAVALYLLDVPAASWEITTGNNNLSINNNSASWTNRLTITQAGFIGVGTATPGYAVDVVGSLNVSGSLLVNGVPFSSGTTWLISGANIYYNTGNVGIGTATPGYTVDVVGSVNVSGSFLVNGVPFSGGGSSQWTTSGNNIYFDTGNVGIGTSSPASPLHLYSSSFIPLTLQQSGSDSNYITFISDGEDYGYIGLESGDGTGIFSDGIVYEEGQTPVPTNTAYGMAIGTPTATNLNLGTNGLVRMTVVADGKVGIGTTTPVGLLDVYGANPTLRIKTSTAAYLDGFASLLFDTITTSYPLAQITATDVGVSPSVYQGILQFWTQYNATLVERMRITSTGNVGIGVANPIKLLSVAGSGMFGYIAGSKKGIVIDNEDAYGTTPCIQGVSSSFAPNSISINPVGGAVGIGVTTPVGLLSVALDGNGTNNPGFWSGSYALFGPGASSITGSAVGITWNTVGNYGSLVCITAGVLWRDMHYAADQHIFRTQAVERMRISTAGNVGIGTDNPTAATLHVVGSIYASQDITALSDQRHKQNIVPLTNCLDAVCSLTGYSYTRTDYKPGESQIGLIAQEVEQVYPQAVNYDSESDIYSLNYNSLIAPLVQSIKELREQVNQLKARLG
jgi:hypothetical protein